MAWSMWIGRPSAALDIDEFAPRLSFFFNSHSDFFEEIAKYRAARRIWALAMRDRYGSKSERSCRCCVYTRQTAGCSGSPGSSQGNKCGAHLGNPVRWRRSGRRAIAAHQFS